MIDLASRMRKLSSAAVNGTLAKELGIGRYILTGWLGDTDPKQPRVRMETMEVRAKNVHQAKAQYLRQFKNQLPADVLNPDMGLIVLRVASVEESRQFPADTVPTPGIVKFFKENEGTGFITADGVDYFVHHSEIITGDEEIFPVLYANQQVSFIPATRNGKNIACSVSVAE